MGNLTINNVDFSIIDDECIELVVYGVQVRYPYELEVNEQDMKFAIECAEKIERFIEDKLKECGEERPWKLINILFKE